LSDPVDDAYEKYIAPIPDLEPDSKIECLRCGSENVDRRTGYRGEYKCAECGYFWQIGGRYAT